MSEVRMPITCLLLAMLLVGGCATGGFPIRVVDEKGEPVAGATVMAFYDEAEKYQVVKTNQFGETTVPRGMPKSLTGVKIGKEGYREQPIFPPLPMIRHTLVTLYPE